MIPLVTDICLHSLPDTEVVLALYPIERGDKMMALAVDVSLSRLESEVST